MQNKPNLLDEQMNVTSFYTVDYENKSNWKIGENKPNFQNAQMNVNTIITVDYENKSNWKLGENKPNTKPIKANTNPIQTQFPKSQNERNFYFNKGL